MSILQTLLTETGDPIPGVNIYIENSSLGAASDTDGFFIINNVPPGKYAVVFSSCKVNGDMFWS